MDELLVLECVLEIGDEPGPIRLISTRAVVSLCAR
jgi:hypothetical protein